MTARKPRPPLPRAVRELCQCRRPEAGRDGYTCERCEDAAATAALRATVKALTAERDEARERLHKAEGMANEINILTAENKEIAGALALVQDALQAVIDENNALHVALARLRGDEE